MKILVTGSEGQLGKSLRDVFLGSSHSLLLLDKASLDIADLEKTSKVISSFNPEWIINCAAWTNVDQAEIEQEKCTAVNVIGVKNLIIAAAQVDSKLIQISTDYVFDGVTPTPWKVNDKPNPISYYGQSKAEAESLIQNKYLSQSAIIRTSWLYSKYGSNFVKTLTRIGLSGDSELNVISDQIGQPTSCADLSRLIVEVIEADIRGVILHGTNSGKTSWYGFAQAIFKLSGFEIERIKPILSENYQQKAKRPKNSVLGHENFKELGLGPMPDWDLSLRSEVQGILRAVQSEGFQQ